MSLRIYRAPVNAAIIPIIAIIGPTGTFSLPNPFRLLAIRENAAIIIVMAPAAAIRLVVSIKDRAATDAAMIPIAMAIIMMEPFTFWAPFRPRTIRAIMAQSIVTATTPLAKLCKSTNTAARIPIAADIASMVPVTFAIFCSLPIVRIDTSTFSRRTNPATKAAPLIISSTDNIPTSLQTPTSSMSETDMLSIIPPTLANCCFLPILLLNTRAFTNITKAAANAAPFSISSTDNRLTSLHTPTISAIAIVTLITIPPTLLTLLPALFATLVIAITKIANAVANAAPFSISSPDRLPINLHTPTISIMASDNLTIIPPMPVTFLAYLDTRPIIDRNASIPTAIAASPLKP